MKERTIASRVIAACCAIAATFAAAACALHTRDAVAAPTTDSASGSIAISYQHKSSDSETGSDSTDFAISDASFNLYKVGQIPASGGATFEPVAPFTDSTAYPVDWSKMTGKDAQVWRDMANTLAGLIAVNKPDATATGVTNASGHLTFTGLSDGLYLAVSDSVEGHQRFRKEPDMDVLFRQHARRSARRRRLRRVACAEYRTENRMCGATAENRGTHRAQNLE